ncbi:hypothetical protein K438DRAFT_1957079 [Mycena galopus ATCC 62051]|nr:hypothetical protein K438DRAFT_1957079 [Mycena galopus ATCC 62051]
MQKPLPSLLINRTSLHRRPSHCNHRRNNNSSINISRKSRTHTPSNEHGVSANFDSSWQQPDPDLNPGNKRTVIATSSYSHTPKPPAGLVQPCGVQGQRQQGARLRPNATVFILKRNEHKLAPADPPGTLGHEDVGGAQQQLPTDAGQHSPPVPYHYPYPGNQYYGAPPFVIHPTMFGWGSKGGPILAQWAARMGGITTTTTTLDVRPGRPGQ